MTEALPRWATKPTAGRSSPLAEQAWRISHVLGHPLMPWQWQVVRTALEVDDRGRLAYRDVVLTVPRQQGKTTLMLALILARALFHSRQHIVYCAQSALDARKKWEADWLPAIEQSPIGSLVRVRRAPGDEGLWFPNGSRQSIAASTQKAAHGQVVDLALVDEAFAYQDARLEQALRPAMMTRQDTQLWIVSTAGTPRFSPYLLDKVERGRAAVEAGLNEGLAYFEWSAPDDADPADPATWRRCMPALGRTVEEPAIRDAQRSMSHSEFARAYLNRWVDHIGDPVVPMDHWATLADPGAERPRDVVLGLDIAPQGSAAAICAVGERDGVLYGAVLESGDGTAWLIPALERCVAAYSPVLMVDEMRAAYLMPELERVTGFQVRAMRTREIVAGCEFFLRLVTEGRFRHRGEPELAAALASAAQRTVGDGWVWSRRGSRADISTLCAMTWATDFFRGAWGD